MATSGTFSWLVTQQQIIQQALLDNGALGEGEVPTAQEFTDCSFKLNNLVKQWMGKQDFAPGLKMWTRQRGSLFLGASKHQYQLGTTGDNWAAGVTNGSVGQTFAQTTVTIAGASIGATVIPVTATTQLNVNDFIGIVCGSDIFWSTISSISAGVSVTIANALTTAASGGATVYNYTTKQQRPLNILTSILRDANSNDTPQNVMTLEDYELLPSKVQPGFLSDPTAFYYESQLTNGQYYIDCYGAQDVTKHLHIVFLRPIQDFDNVTDNPEYPQQWYRALCWGLSKDVTGMFSVQWTDQMEGNFLDAMAMAKEADAEVTSFYFQPYAGSPYEP